MIGIILMAASMAARPQHPARIPHFHHKRLPVGVTDNTVWYIYPGSDTMISGQLISGTSNEYSGPVTVQTGVYDAQVYTYCPGSQSWAMVTIMGSNTTTARLGHSGTGTTATLSEDASDGFFDSQVDFYVGGVYVDDDSDGPPPVMMRHELNLDWGKAKQRHMHSAPGKATSSGIPRFRVRRNSGPTTFAGYGTQYQVLNIGSGNFSFKLYDSVSSPGAEVDWNDSTDTGKLDPYAPHTTGWAEDVYADVAGSTKPPKILMEANPIFP